MGLLEYHAMPSFRDVAHDGVLCIFSNRSTPDPGSSGGSVRAGGMDYSSRYSHPAESLSSSQPGGPPRWTSPLAYGHVGYIGTVWESTHCLV